MKNDFEKEPSSLSIIITFVLLILAIVAYVFIDKYITADPNQKVKNIEEKAQREEGLSEKDALAIAEEKYYIAIATITNTKSDIDKLYNQIKTTDLILNDQTLIDSLNSFNVKTYAQNSSISVIQNYDEAIKDNFTTDFINNNILYPNGFIASINNEYYLITDKIDNYFFKEASFTLVSKTDNEMHFSVTNTNYATSCVSAGETVPSITCTDTTNSESIDFILVKQDNNWKISKLTIQTA